MEAKELLALGFESFESDDTIYYAKELPHIGYSLCTSDDNKFSISTYPEGGILVKLDVEFMKDVHNGLQKGDDEICSFKKSIDNQIKRLIHLSKEGESH